MHQTVTHEVEKSRRGKRTTPALRRLVFGLVDEALLEHYGQNYSDRCYQSSMAIQEAHKALGLDCKLWSGHVCMARVSIVNEEPEFGWAGFWDQDNHVWAFNEFGELVDLTIAHLHQHSATATRVDLPIPAIWWDDVTRWPSTMIYLPVGNPTPEFEPAEAQDTEQFLAVARKKIATKFEEAIGRGYEEDVLSGPESLVELSEAQHPWVLLSSYAQGMPMPEWIQARMDEARRKASGRR